MILATIFAAALAVASPSPTSDVEMAVGCDFGSGRTASRSGDRSRNDGNRNCVDNNRDGRCDDWLSSNGRNMISSILASRRIVPGR